MRTYLVILFSLLFAVSCKSNENTSYIKGNGKIVSTEIPINNYSELNIQGSCVLVYEQKLSKKPYLRVEIDENLRNNLDIKVRNGSLYIGLRGNVSKVNKFKVYTNSPGLSKVKLRGSGSVTLDGKINSTNLDVSIAGSGNLKANKLQSSYLKVSISGSGGASLGGDVYDSDIRISGSGNVNAYGLKSKNVKCRVSGSGNAKVYASQSLDINISGSGNAYHKGSAKHTNFRASGSGKIKAE